jgi:hypothetical protein
VTPKYLIYTLPTLVGVGHQRMESTSTACNQWLSLAKTTLKVPLAGTNRSLVAITNRCGEGISVVWPALNTQLVWAKKPSHTHTHTIARPTLKEGGEATGGAQQ